MQAGGPAAPLAAALLMVSGMAIIGVIDNYVARVAETLGLWQFHLARTLMMLPLIGLMALAGLGGLRPRRRGAVILRSLLVATGLLLYFAAAGLMPLAQALAGLFTSPIFILLISATVLRQRIGPWRILAAGCGFAGVLLVLQPDPGAFDARILLPVAGGFFYALGAIATRSLCAGESTVALLAGVMLALGAMGAGGLAVLSLVPADSAAGPQGFLTRGWVWPMTAALPWVILQAVGSVVAVFLLIKAYQRGEPSYVSIFEYSVMLFGPLYGWLAMGQGLNPWQVAGIVLIALAGGVIALRSA